MSPGVYNITTPSNGTFTQELTYLDAAGNVVNLTGYTARMQVVQGSTDVIELTNGNGMITLGSISPNIVLLIPVATMEGLVCPSGQYDLVLRSGGGIQTVLLAGSFVVAQGITP